MAIPIDYTVVHPDAMAFVSETPDGDKVVTVEATYGRGTNFSTTSSNALTFGAAENLFNDLRRALYGGHL